MHAMVLETVGKPLALRNVPDPMPGRGQVLIAMEASALNHRDLWIQKGLYAGIALPMVLGSDGAGVVVECGDEVDRSWIGREVIVNPSLDWGDNARAQGKGFRILGMPDFGTFSERLAIAIGQVTPRPEHLSQEQAAALPLAGLTAYRALFSRAALKAGERVLVTGIGGGVALFALQFAVAAGARVWVTSGSSAKIELARTLGAQGGANYRNTTWGEDLAEANGFEVIVDGAGGPGWATLVDLAAPGARLVHYGATSGNPAELPLRKIFWKQLNVMGSTMGSRGDFEAMTEFVARNRIVPTVDSVRPLPEVNEALREMDGAGQTGKLVLRHSKSRER